MVPSWSKDLITKRAISSIFYPEFRLSIEPWQFKPEDAVEKVDLLMRYQPKIDQFHLRRMGLIKLKYPDVYQQIISAYPQLKVVDDNALPLSICGI